MQWSEQASGRCFAGISREQAPSAAERKTCFFFLFLVLLYSTFWRFFGHFWLIFRALEGFACDFCLGFLSQVFDNDSFGARGSSALEGETLVNYSTFWGSNFLPRCDLLLSNAKASTPHKTSQQPLELLQSSPLPSKSKNAYLTYLNKRTKQKQQQKIRSNNLLRVSSSTF